jgi:phospholipid/cholesterol/gamma-HCH transport system substrate-binding protein
MKRNLVEMTVGLFMCIGFGALIYLAVNLGEVPFLTKSSTYVVKAEFDNVAGVKKGASVQIAGVTIGDVSGLELGPNDAAILSLRINNSVKIPVDSIASVKSQGIIGDKYIQLSIGGDETLLKSGETIQETESSVDIESLISKFAFGSAKK